MNLLKKTVFVLALGAVLVWAGASSAFAACTQLVSTATPATNTNTRIEGLAEAQGALIVTCGVAADIPASATRVTLQLNSGAAALAAAAIGSAITPAGGVVVLPNLAQTGNNTSTFGFPTLQTTGVTFATNPTVALGPAVNQISYTFTPSAASAAGATLTIGSAPSPIRVNPSASGGLPGSVAAGGAFAATAISGVVTITQVGADLVFGTVDDVVVAVTSGTAATATTATIGTTVRGLGNVTLGAAAAAAVFTVPATVAGAIANALSIAQCSPSVATPSGSPASILGNPDTDPVGANSLLVTFTEGAADAWRSSSRETNGLGGINGTRVMVRFAGIPSGIVIYAPRTVGAGVTPNTGVIIPAASVTVLSRVNGANEDGSGGTVGAAVNNQFDRVDQSSSGVVTLVYEVTGTEAATGAQPAVATTLALFVAFTGDTAAGIGLAQRITGVPALAPASSAGTVAAADPQFAANTALPIPVASTGICASFLLFPWAYSGGGIDTGMAIANTGAAVPSATGVPGLSSKGPETGNVVLWLFPKGGALPTSGIQITNNLKPGDTVTFTLSAGNDVTKAGVGTVMASGGYIVAACSFRRAHGFGFISSNLGAPGGWSQGYMALSIVPSASGARAGGVEALAQ